MRRSPQPGTTADGPGAAPDATTGAPDTARPPAPGAPEAPLAPPAPAPAPAPAPGNAPDAHAPTRGTTPDAPAPDPTPGAIPDTPAPDPTPGATPDVPAPDDPTPGTTPDAPAPDDPTPGALASFLRFVGIGGGVGLASGAAVALLAGALPFALANALVSVVSTILATELHARFTFGSGLRPATGRGLLRCGLRHHLQSAGTAAAAYSATTLAVLVLHLVARTPGLAVEQTVYLAASGLAGIGRFLALRLYVFTTTRRRPAPPAALSPAVDLGLGLQGARTRRESLTTAS
ncbi:hypothetical protein ACF09E_30790 [Streptomyces sp. NPDC014891]|uniref:hypothetical protein n=1 Tax=Streptomyces sp. NPDC014891 TaxID=3364929 RepID=UPI0036FC4D27